MPSASSYTKTKVDALLSGIRPVKLFSFRYDHDPFDWASATKFGTGALDGRLYLPKPTALDIAHVNQPDILEFYVHPSLVDDVANSGGMRHDTWMSVFGPGMLVFRWLYYFNVEFDADQQSWLYIDVANSIYENLGYEWFVDGLPPVVGASSKTIQGSHSIFIDDTWPTDDVALVSAFSAMDDVTIWSLRQARTNMVFYPNAPV